MPDTNQDHLIIHAILNTIPAFRALSRPRQLKIISHTAKVGDYIARPEGIPANRIESQARLTNRVITEWAAATGKNLTDRPQPNDGVFPANLAVSAEQMVAYADLIATVASSIDQFVEDTQDREPRYELKLDIASWRLDLQLPSSSTGLAVELNGTLTGGRLDPGQEFGNLSLCTPNDLGRFRSSLDPQRVQFGYAPATWHDGYIRCEPAQILAVIELLKTATRVYLTLTVSDHHPNLGYIIHSLQAYSHT